MTDIKKTSDDIVSSKNEEGLSSPDKNSVQDNAFEKQEGANPKNDQANQDKNNSVEAESNADANADNSDEPQEYLSKASELAGPDEGEETQSADAIVIKKDTSDDQDIPGPAPAVEKASKAPRAKKKKGRIIRWLVFIFLLILICLAVASIYKIFEYFDKKNAEISAQIEQLKSQNKNINARIETGNATDNKQNKDYQAVGKRFDQIDQKLKSAEQRLASQRKRILSMSTTSKEDWLLAEAEYLLKLANQRILVERNAQGARSLLVEADNILRDLDDPDLFPIRQQLAKDIAAVRLIEKIDVEGLYLRMQALIGSIDELTTRPDWDQRKLSSKPSQKKALSVTAEKQNNITEKSFFSSVRNKFLSFTQRFDGYIRIRKHDEDEDFMLVPTPAQSYYYKQNLQLMLEKVSLALLREQQVVFEKNLSQAHDWLKDKFPVSAKQQAFLSEIEEIRQVQVVQNLPDVTQSLEALKEYILKLHALEGTVNEGGGN